MTAINAVTDLSKDGDIAIVTLNSPPVNALGADVRDGLANGFKQAIDDASVKAIVLICEADLHRGARTSPNSASRRGRFAVRVETSSKDRPSR